MNYYYERRNTDSIPVIKTMEYKNRNNSYLKDYYKIFKELDCVKEIMIPNIKTNCDCISAMKYSNERIVNAKLLEEFDNVYKIAVYDCSINGISFFDVSKKFFIIDELDFLNYKYKKPEKQHSKQWVI